MLGDLSGDMEMFPYKKDISISNKIVENEFFCFQTHQQMYVKKHKCMWKWAYTNSMSKLLFYLEMSILVREVNTPVVTGFQPGVLSNS